jgi:murein endopeptidase
MPYRSQNTTVDLQEAFDLGESSRLRALLGLDGGPPQAELEALVAPPVPAVVPAGNNPAVSEPLPASGTGYWSYATPDKRYARPEVIRAVQAIGSAWARAHPNGPRIGVGNISLKGGGTYGEHVSHTGGLDVDILPVRNDGKEGNVKCTDPVYYSRPLTQELINLIRANGVLVVELIGFSDPQVTGTSLWQKHEDHLHVRFTTTPAQPGTSRLELEVPAASPVQAAQPLEDPAVIAPLPEAGDGFLSYTSADKRFAGADVLRALQVIGSAWARAHPTGPRIEIGDISWRGGGRFDPHVEHRHGRDVDIRPPYGDGGPAQRPVYYWDKHYSRALTQELVNLIRANPVLIVDKILFNDQKVTGVRPKKGHDNHLHVSFGSIPPASAPVPRGAPQPLAGEVSTPGAPPAGLGTLVARRPDGTIFRYRFIPWDMVETARFIVDVAGGENTRDSQAAIWAMLNRYGLFAHRRFPTFHQFLRASLTRPQQRPWSQLPASARGLAEAALKGRVPNSIGPASEFASTYVHYHNRFRRYPTTDQWRQFTHDFARQQGWRWIGPVPGLHQQRNAFFIDQRAAGLLRDAVRVEPPR